VTLTGQRPQTRLRQIPEARGNAVLGLLSDIRRDRLSLMLGLAERYGDAVRLSMGPKSLYFFNNPDHAKHVLSDNHANYTKGIGLRQAKRVLGDGLLTSEGEVWKRQRKTIAPAFHRDRLSRFAGAVVDEAHALIDRWKARPDGDRVEVVADMTRLTLGVMGKALLDTDLGDQDDLGAAFAVVQDQAMFEMVTLGLLPQTNPLPRQRRFRAASRKLDEAVAELAARRRAEGFEGRDDMLSRLIAEYPDENDAVGRARLKDELITILLAGHETTASTLAWTWYRVSLDPRIRRRMRQEAVDVLGTRDPRFSDLHDLRYIGQVVQETMRLYPAVWLLTRQAKEPDGVGGYPVPAGADVVISPYTLHRHRGYWTDPEKFDPDRFDPGATDRIASRHRYAYLPFGAGPRFCIGNNLGTMEAVLTAAMVAREFRLESVPGHRVVADPMLTLRVRDGLPMTVHRA